MRFSIYMPLALAAVAGALPPSDGIAALVGDQAIYVSDVRDAARQAAANPALAGLTGEQKADRILAQLVDEKVLVARAQAESLDVVKMPQAKPDEEESGPRKRSGNNRPARAIQADDPELNSRVDAHIANLVKQAGSDEVFANTLRAQLGVSPAQFRVRLIQQFREDRLKEKLQEKYVGKQEPTREEVLAFYREYRDSLPVLADQVKLSQIVIKVKPDVTRDSVAAKEARNLVAKLVAGASFDSLAKENSQDPGSARNGGDIGFMKRGELDPAYERAALGLEIGRWTSAPVRSRFGWHVIELAARRDQEFRTRHILRAVMPQATDSVRTRELADSLRRVSLSGVPFASIARQWSDEKASAAFGGVLGWYSERDLQGNFKTVIDAIPTGRVSDPVWTGDAFLLLRVDERVSSRSISPEEDWLQLSRLANQILTQRKLRTFVERWRNEVSIEKRIEGSSLAQRAGL